MSTKTHNLDYCHKHGRGQFGRCQLCIDELTSLGIQVDKDRIKELEQKLSIAIETLKFAEESLADWGQYASDYFQEKYSLENDVKRIHDVIQTLEK